MVVGGIILIYDDDDDDDNGDGDNNDEGNDDLDNNGKTCFHQDSREWEAPSEFLEQLLIFSPQDLLSPVSEGFVSVLCFSSAFLLAFQSRAFPFSISSTHLSKFSVEGVKGRLQELRKVGILMAARTNQ